ncbi:MAG: hypothetical protein AAF804_14855, partial [Bacteroidota bacterium]
MRQLSMLGKPQSINKQIMQSGIKLKIFVFIALGVCLIAWTFPIVSVPNFKSNATPADSIGYRIHQIMPDDGMLMISLERDSYWYQASIVKTIIFDKRHKWKLAVLFREKESRELRLSSIRSISRKKSRKADSLVNFLNNSQFLKLSLDTLNLTSMVLPDTFINGEVLSREEFASISDGLHYRFEVLSK